jgi:TonB family protein
MAKWLSSRGMTTALQVELTVGKIPCVSGLRILLLLSLLGSVTLAQKGKVQQPQEDRAASVSPTRPSLDWPPMRTKSGALISDCVPLNLKTVYAPDLKYPEAARTARISGSVSVDVVIDKKGRVIWTNVLEGHRLLRAAATNTARGTRFKPTKDCLGRKLRMSTILYYDFKP